MKDRKDRPISDIDPSHYRQGDQETIDKIREILSNMPSKLEEIKGCDEPLFLGFCLGQVVRYSDRAGLKGPKEVCLGKAVWYAAMAAHILVGDPDPRDVDPSEIDAVRARFPGLVVKT